MNDDKYCLVGCGRDLDLMDKTQDRIEALTLAARKALAHLRIREERKGSAEAIAALEKALAG